MPLSDELGPQQLTILPRDVLNNHLIDFVSYYDGINYDANPLPYNLIRLADVFKQAAIIGEDYTTHRDYYLYANTPVLLSSILFRDRRDGTCILNDATKSFIDYQIDFFRYSLRENVADYMVNHYYDVLDNKGHIRVDAATREYLKTHYPVNVYTQDLGYRFAPMSNMYLSFQKIIQRARKTYDNPFDPSDLHYLSDSLMLKGMNYKVFSQKFTAEDSK